MKKTFYKWIVLQNNEVVRYGIVDEPIEIDVEKVFPSANSSADRDLCEMQEYADKYLKECNYDFRYKEIKVDFYDLVDD